MTVVEVLDSVSVIDDKDETLEFHKIQFSVSGKEKEFQIRFQDSEELKHNDAKPKLVLFLPSEDIIDGASEEFFNFEKLYSVDPRIVTNWIVKQISNKFPDVSDTWQFQYTGNLRREIKHIFKLAMISKDRREGKFQIKINNDQWVNIEKQSQSGPVREVIRKKRQQWVKKRLDDIIGQDSNNNPYFHPKQKITCNGIERHAPRDISHLTYVGLDDAANFFSSIYALKQSGIDISKLRISVRYAENYDDQMKTEWLKNHSRMEGCKIDDFVHQADWESTNFIIDTYTLGEWFTGCKTAKEHEDRFAEQIQNRSDALTTGGKMILVYPCLETPLCCKPEKNILDYLKNPKMMQKFDLKVSELTNIGAAAGFILEKIVPSKPTNKLPVETSEESVEKQEDMFAQPTETVAYDSRPISLDQNVDNSSTGLQVVSDFDDMRNAISVTGTSRCIAYRMEENHQDLMDLVNHLKRKLFDSEGASKIIVLGPPGIRKTTMVATALFPSGQRPGWGDRQLPTVVVGTPAQAYRNKDIGRKDEQILFLDDLQDHMAEIRQILAVGEGESSEAELIRKFLSGLSQYKSVIVTWKTDPEHQEQQECIANLESTDIKCVDVFIHNRSEDAHASATQQAKRYVEDRFSEITIFKDLERDVEAIDFTDYINTIQSCLQRILLGEELECLEYYEGCNQFKSKLTQAIKSAYKQKGDVPILVNPETVLQQLIQENKQDVFSNLGVDE